LEEIENILSKISDPLVLLRQHITQRAVFNK